MSNEREEAIRRRTQRRRKLRRKRIITAFISFLIFSFAIFAILCFTVLFPIKQISPKGSKLYTAQQIVSACDFKEKDNLLLVSEKKLAEKIRARLPFVDSVEISRKLPDTLIITVYDAKEYACFNYDGLYYTVSKNGYVLSTYSEKPQSTFEIISSGAKLNVGYMAELTEKKQAEPLKVIADNLVSKNISIDYIDVTNSLNLSVKVEGRFIVNLGSNTNLDKKIAHLNGMLSDIDKDKTGKINLSMWTSQKTEGTFVEGDIK